MPVALASAMSAGKGKESLSTPLSEDCRKKNGFTNGTGIHPMPSNGNTMIRNLSKEPEDGKKVSCKAREKV